MPYFLRLAFTIFIFIASGNVVPVFAQQIHPLETPDAERQRQWVEDTYARMSLREKVGQLFMIDVTSSDPTSKLLKKKELIRKYHLGGVIFMKGGPRQQAKLTNEFQSLSKIPMLIGIDAEWGLSMRLDSTYAFPWNMTLGAIQDNQLIEQTGVRIAEHCRRMGVHFNFGPVLDINTNPKNPIIGNRSFGEDKINVTQKASAFMKGLHKGGLLSCGKHFPGHGDTDADSHKTLPTVLFDDKRIDQVELYPYRRLISEGLSSVMVAHLNIPALEARPNTPSSISSNIIEGVLKDRLGFNGLIFTDALNMKGASEYKESGEIDLAAFLAGNDILLISEDIPKAFQLVIAACYNGTISEKRLSHSVKKILMAKYKVGLHDYRPIDLFHLTPDLNTRKDELLTQRLYEDAITVIKNKENILPIKGLEKQKIAYIPMGDDDGTLFFEALNTYAQVDKIEENSLTRIIEKLQPYTQVIVGFHKSSAHPWKSYQFKEKEMVWLYEIARQKDIILSVFTSPYALLDAKTTTNFEAIQIAYQNTPVAQQKAAQVIFGARGSYGKLPVAIGTDYKVGTGIETLNLGRLAFGLPEMEGVNSIKLRFVDSLVQQALREEMTPGLQLLIAKNNRVIYNKSFGYHTYEKKLPVRDTDVYDLASLTKILATLPMVMKMYENEKISLNTTVGELVPSFQGSNKESISVKDMLSHYARLQAWIPFYQYTLDSITQKPSELYYHRKSSDLFTNQVAKNLFFRKDMTDSIFSVIRDSELLPRLKYKYSDLPYYILKKNIEAQYNANLDVLTHQLFYAPLGASTMGYLPLSRLDKDRIVPTEDDQMFRGQVIHGFVHDQGAALLGGVGGHAGLFGSALDVAKVMQMYLNKGMYGGKQYVSSATVDAFNTCYYCHKKVRRGIGFDKPQLRDSGPTCGCVSMSSFGHSGFTGTYTWADPEENLVYVFLSNRTYPDVNNRKLIRSDLRTKIQQRIYDAIEKKS